MIRLALRVSREHAEVVLAELLELAPSGVEEVDLGDEGIEYAVYGPPGELPALPDLQAAAGGALIEVSSREVADDWSERWREFHKPLVLGDRLVVRPPWEPEQPSVPSSNSIEIVIDPGQAFGTGAHATTRLCLELLVESAGADSIGGSAGAEPPVRLGSFLDLGCGSGVLAIAAAKLGFDPVVALDYDPASVAASIDNAAVNDVAIEVRRHDLRREPTPPAETIAANLLGPLLIEWAGELASPGAAARPRTVIASGMLAVEIDRVAAAFAQAGLEVAKQREHGEWAALLLNREVR
ncbi:MAG: 50S ribosomal protein L11 methyltransferase [Solirubrobacteraceae bacterium]